MKQLAIKFVVTYYVGIFNTYFFEFYQVRFLKIKFNLLAKQTPKKICTSTPCFVIKMKFLLAKGKQPL